MNKFDFDRIKDLYEEMAYARMKGDCRYPEVFDNLNPFFIELNWKIVDLWQELSRK